MSDEVSQALEDGYIECTECGHTLEWNHNTKGCDICHCRIRWTVREKQDLRQRHGLPRRWKSD